ncbi:MAG: hypothetical protein KME47_09850 [Nodosilinea sp. WJT8-NPBG4]|jgi:hypothetical protein|nr:hypothetical protein [Nodosilinea sp. WJT8-NPBG4]
MSHQITTEDILGYYSNSIASSRKERKSLAIGVTPTCEKGLISEYVLLSQGVIVLRTKDINEAVNAYNQL